MTAKMYTRVRDFSDEYGSFSLNLPDVDALNFDSTITAIALLQTAIAAATIGNITALDLTIDTGLAGADVRPANAFAQRELRVCFKYQDDVTGKKYQFTIPCADASVVAQGGTDRLDLTASWAAAIVTAFEALVVSEAGNSITVYAGELIGVKS